MPSRQKEKVESRRFIPGLDLNRAFFQQVVKPLVDKHFPGLKYSAGLLGEGSDVLGFDNPQSMDHNWGPRLVILLSEHDHHYRKAAIDKMLREQLPPSFMDFPTNYTEPSDRYLVQRMAPKKNGPVNHLIKFYTAADFFGYYLGLDPHQELKYEDWLTFPQASLLTVTRGEIYYDNLQGVEELRHKFAYYPAEVWTYLYTMQWARIGNEESLMGRAGEAADELGSRLIARDLVYSIMQLCFLIEHHYFPYLKWFGRAFSKLKCAPELIPTLLEALDGKTWQIREDSLGKAYSVIARLHNDLKLTEPIRTEVREFEGRPYKTIYAYDVCLKIEPKLKPFFRKLKYKLGGVDQFVSDVLYNEKEYVFREMRHLIR